jgi:lysophospholipase
MRVDVERVKIQGHLLHRLTMHPEDDVPLRAAAIFYHGQGDYAERYPEVLRPFTERGIRCVVTDLPGHGYSPGRRGHCGDEVLLDCLIEDTLKSFGSLPYAVMGHSMGGLLAARHLVLAGQGHLPAPSLAWINAPLVQPSNGRSKFFLSMVRAAAVLFPKLTISTGVTAKMCRAVDDDVSPSKSPAPRHPLWHRRISLGWGRVLLAAERLLLQSIDEVSAEIPILVTQGGMDPVCPPEITREFFQRLPQKTKQYHESDEGLHELFSDANKEQLDTVLGDWLDRSVAVCDR